MFASLPAWKTPSQTPRIYWSDRQQQRQEQHQQPTQQQPSSQLPLERAAADDIIDVLEACGSRPQQAQWRAIPELASIRVAWPCEGSAAALEHSAWVSGQYERCFMEGDHPFISRHVVSFSHMICSGHHMSLRLLSLLPVMNMSPSQKKEEKKEICQDDRTSKTDVLEDPQELCLDCYICAVASCLEKSCCDAFASCFTTTSAKRGEM